MRKPLWITLVVLLAIPVVSLAQYNEQGPSKINVRGGMHQPAGSRLKDESPLWVDFGVDYVLAFDEAQSPQDVASLSYTGSSKNLLQAKLLGLQFMRYWSSSTEPDKGFYYGAGAGVYLAAVKLDEAFPTPAVDESKVQAGLTVMGGYHLSPYWFAEVRYTKMEELAEGVDLSGLSVFVGVKRFLE